ncbi:LacI family DNA-binding transcriptional regulator [Corticicoccus populi]|uniref:LacI family DNA-binding transcriptional regulator n=1 Tax=Corticicoccus populi TaxID=1812821 RepID=A0ABW5WXC5_9STAP
MPVTLKDIARACGVSYSTVSKALKDSPLVTQQTKSIIKQKAEEMNYIPNNSARSLVSNKSGTIGLIWPAVDRIAVTTLATQVNAALQKHGYFMVVSIDKPEVAAGKFLELRFDGVIVFDEGPETRLSNKITKNVPVIAYGVSKELHYPIVNVNHDTAIKKAVDQLIKDGHHSIDYVGELDTDDIRQTVKRDTFKEYCKEKNIKYRLIDSEGLSEASTREALTKFLKNEKINDAVICGSYDITMGFLHHLDKKEPKSIVSFDNIKQFDAIDIPLYTVGVPAETIAEHLVMHLHENIQSGNTASSKVINLYPELTYHQ